MTDLSLLSSAVALPSFKSSNPILTKNTSAP